MTAQPPSMQCGIHLAAMVSNRISGFVARHQLEAFEMASDRIIFRVATWFLLTLPIVGCKGAEFSGVGGQRDAGGNNNDTTGPGNDNLGSSSLGGPGSYGGQSSQSGSGMTGDGSNSGDGTGGGGIHIMDGKIEDRCDVPTAAERNMLSFYGEDYPFNPQDADDGWIPGDYDDFNLSMNGAFSVEGSASNGVGGILGQIFSPGGVGSTKIGFKRRGTLTINYTRADSKCTHAFTFKFKKCPNLNSSDIPNSGGVLNPGFGNSGTLTLQVPSDNVYLDIILRTSPGSGHCASSNWGGTPARDFHVLDPLNSPLKI